MARLEPEVPLLLLKERISVSLERTINTVCTQNEEFSIEKGVAHVENMAIDKGENQPSFFHIFVENEIKLGEKEIITIANKKEYFWRPQHVHIEVQNHMEILKVKRLKQNLVNNSTRSMPTSKRPNGSQCALRRLQSTLFKVLVIQRFAVDRAS
jgi:hypothetical protein